ncbi:MAG: radical SAM protein [Oscillospiraceae bacterium]|jgi:MoaA/NifB/PqqE/SkfB family radical SAM enzyme
MELLSKMEQGARDIAARTGEYYRTNENGRVFLMSFVPALLESAEKRRALAEAGSLAPQYLICSISARCNLHCAGCYARAEGNCTDNELVAQLDAAQWREVFRQAEEMGVSFILLAGGEPLLRRDVLRAAADFPTIAFPVFTNGTLFDDEYLALFDRHRNLVPVVSIEGDEAATDERRGAGVSNKIETALEALRAQGVLFAASVTVTRENLRTVASREYIELLRDKGCGILFFIEYVPAQPGTEALVLTPEETRYLAETVDALRERYTDMSIFSFPGDEDETGGCLAAGRGFFHINPAGGAEPCPFSPFSVMNVREHSLPEVLNSAFFGKVREISQSDQTHFGGCTLFRHEQEIFRLFGAEMGNR